MQESKKKKDGKKDIDVAKQDGKKMATVPSTGKQPPADGQVAEKDAKPLNKRKRETAELLQLAEKLQAKPARTGMKSNRKKYEFLNVVSFVDFMNNQKFLKHLISCFLILSRQCFKRCVHSFDQFVHFGRYLQEKKKKRLKNSTYEAMLREPEKEKIEFGDIVQEPPKLSFPAKAKVSNSHRTIYIVSNALCIWVH